MKSLYIAIVGLVAATSAAQANYGYCFTPGLMGGTKVIVHDQVREADFWDGATVAAYRKLLEESRRFRFGSLTCPGFDTQADADESLAKLRQTFLENGYADFPFPVRPAD
jgi:hypothetical protein